MGPEEAQKAIRVSLKGMGINLALFFIKGILGLWIHSASLLSDAVHSLTDIFSTLIVFVGIGISSRPPDRGHPYGHEKIECIFALLLGMMLFAIGGGIGWEGIVRLNRPVVLEAPLILTMGAVSAAVLSIAAKEWMYRITIRCAREIGSASMAADAWHHRSDAFSSVGSLIGILGLWLGYPVIDAAACLVISVFIFKAALDICIDACRKMIDAAAPLEVEQRVQQIVRRNQEVLKVDSILTRQFGSRIYVDMEITLDRSASFEHAHQIAHEIHDQIEGELRSVKHCMIHFNPSP